MGYTQYLYLRRDFTDAEWAHLRWAFERLDRYKPRGAVDWRGEFSPLFLALHDDSPYEPPRCDAEVIAFNGWSPDGHDLGHETFVLKRTIPADAYRPANDKGEAFDCCKTAMKPYDLMVTAMLIVVDNDCAGAVRVSSDGARDDWTRGLELVQRALGGPYAYPAMLRREEEEED